MNDSLNIVHRLDGLQEKPTKSVSRHTKLQSEDKKGRLNGLINRKSVRRTVKRKGIILLPFDN